MSDQDDAAWLRFYARGCDVENDEGRLLEIAQRIGWQAERVAELEAALRPFAKFAAMHPKATSSIWHVGVPLSDCRRAAELLTDPAP